MKKEILAAVIALILSVSSAAVISGCGCNNDKKDQESTTAPATTVASATENTTKSKKATQPSTQKSTGANSQTDLQTLALNSYGVSASDGYSAVQTGATNNSEGTFNIFAVYDSGGNLKTYVYIHTSGYPIYVGQDVFESVHGGGNSVDNGNGGDNQNNDNSQNDGGNQGGGNDQSSADNQGGGQSSNQSSNQGGGNQGYGGGGNQGGDGHDYADKGY